MCMLSYRDDVYLFSSPPRTSVCVCVRACVLSSVWLCASKYKCKYKYMYRDKHIGRRALFDRGIEKASTARMAELQAYKFGHLVLRGQRG